MTVNVLNPDAAILQQVDGHATVYHNKDRARLVAAAPTMKAVLEDLEDSIDKQLYDERMREELEIPLEREYSVNLTERQIQAITRVLNKAERC